MIRILFLPLFLYAGMAIGYALAAFGTIDPALMCVASKSECGLVAAALFDSSALSIQVLSDAVWKVGISDLLVIFGVLALGASGLARRKEKYDFLLSLIVFFVAAWVFVMGDVPLVVELRAGGFADLNVMRPVMLGQPCFLRVAPAGR